MIEYQQKKQLFYLEKTLKFCIFIAEVQIVIMETKNLKVKYKSTQLISILSKNFAGEMNLARPIT
jgi:hypothetical protein